MAEQNSTNSQNAKTVSKHSSPSNTNKGLFRNPLTHRQPRGVGYGSGTYLGYSGYGKAYDGFENDPSDSSQNPATRRRMANAADTIDLVELFFYLLPKAWIIILAGLVGAVLLGIYTFVFVTPIYSSTATIYIFSSTTSITNLTNLQISNSLTVDFTMLADTKNVAQAALDSMENPGDMTYQSFLSMVTVTNPTDSHMLVITANNPDPVMAADMANAMAEQMRIQIANVMNTEKPSTVQEALVSKSPISPSMPRNMAMGFIVFGGIVGMIFVVMFMMKDTIDSEEDVKKYLGVNVIASVSLGKRGNFYTN